MSSTVLDENQPELRSAPLSQPSVVYAADGSELTRFYSENRTPVDIDEISQPMQNAIVAIEDERFYEHNGTDPQAIIRAAVNNLTSDTTQGGSTITHQYVSLILLNADYLEGREDLVMGGTTTLGDRLNEARLAVQLEQEMTKEEILAGYLNIVLLGRQNYGVEAAAQYYWGIPAAELNIQQSALLAGMVQSPNFYDPLTNPDAATDRRNVVLGTMLRNEYITQDEYEQAVASDLGLENVNPPASGCIAAQTAPYFCDYIERLILADDTFGDTEEERRALLERGGLRIHTTLEPDIQEEAERTLRTNVPVGDDSGAVGTIVTLENGTGNVLAMAQSTNYNPDGEDLSTGNTTVNYNMEQAWGESSGFPVGSTLKPFVAAAWVEGGGSMDDVVTSSENEYPYGEEWEAGCMPGGSVQLLGEEDEAWEVSNVIEALDGQDTTVDFGLYYSLNTATVATAYGMDLCRINEVTERMGIQRATSTSQGGRTVDFVETPSAVIGGTELSPMTLTEAYTAFTSDGQRCQHRVIEEITDVHGNEYSGQDIACEQVLDPDIAAQVNDTLINIAEDIPDTAPAFPMLGKTGTSHNGTNTWFAGGTEGITSTVHVGSWQGTGPAYRLADVTIGGRYYGGQLYGGTLAAPMWYQYTSNVAGDYPTGDFTEAEDSPFEDRRAWRYSFSQSEGTQITNDDA
nr:transglycosylase domain-containing protein [Nesterenkonia ebinurensis]